MQAQLETVTFNSMVDREGFLRDASLIFKVGVVDVPKEHYIPMSSLKNIFSFILSACKSLKGQDIAFDIDIVRRDYATQDFFNVATVYKTGNTVSCYVFDKTDSPMFTYELARSRNYSDEIVSGDGWVSFVSNNAREVKRLTDSIIKKNKKNIFAGTGGMFIAPKTISGVKDALDVVTGFVRRDIYDSFQSIAVSAHGISQDSRALPSDDGDILFITDYHPKSKVAYFETLYAIGIHIAEAMYSVFSSSTLYSIEQLIQGLAGNSNLQWERHAKQLGIFEVSPMEFNFNELFALLFVHMVLINKREDIQLSIMFEQAVTMFEQAYRQGFED